MIRFLNAVSIVALIGCAIYAYDVKYQTLYSNEQLVKIRREIDREHDIIGVLRAEWTLLTRPARIQTLAEKHLTELQPIDIFQIVRANEIPAKTEHFDAIGRELTSLGISGPTNTPIDDSDHAATPSHSTGLMLTIGH